MLARTLTALSALALLTAPARADDADEALKKLEGTWQAVKIVNDGADGDAESLKGQRLVIRGDKYTLMQPEGEIRGFLVLDPSRSPAHMDASFDDPDGGSGTVECIYKLEGDRLSICWSVAGGRPSDFAASAGSGSRLMVLEREKGID